MFKNSKKNYGLVTKIFHWSISLLIIVMLIAGYIMVSLEPTSSKWYIYSLHKATGILIIMLSTLRLLWKLLNIKVIPLVSVPTWQQKIANLNHTSFYYLMIIMPLSGLLMSLSGGFDFSFFGLFTIRSVIKSQEFAKIFWNIHALSAVVLSSLIGLHISAAFYHHFVRRDNTLLRMIKSI
ncbi:MAG: cytochrome b [Janthinobacterium lividum]